MTLPNRMNKIQKSLPFILILGSLLQGCAPAGGGSAATPAAGNEQVCTEATEDANFFEEIPNAAAYTETQGAQPLRARQVLVNVNALRAKLKKSVARSVQLPVFNDKVMDVFVEEVNQIAPGNLTVTGHLTGDENSSVTLALNNNVFLANIHPSNGPRYTVEYTGNGAHTIKEEDSVQGEEEDDCLTAESPEARPENADAEMPADGAEPTNAAMAMSSTPVIDMLVAYTPGARSAAGGTDAMKAKIAMGIADSNKAFANSGVNLKVRLVGTMEVRQNDRNNFSGDLDRLKAKGDGMWDEVHAERTRLGADQVTMVGVYANNSVAGIGYIKAAASSAFTIVKVSAFNIYSFTHELGHNVGLNHSDGFVSSSGRFRTIMAYGSVPRILRFSNPSLNYLNFSTGNSAHNSASILNRYASTTANFAVSKVMPVNTAAEPVAADASQPCN